MWQISFRPIRPMLTVPYRCRQQPIDLLLNYFGFLHVRGIVLLHDTLVRDVLLIETGRRFLEPMQSGL